MRPALHTWQINSIIKPNICVSWTQMDKETVTDKEGMTKCTDCTINFAHHASLPHETELARVKRKNSPPFLSMCQSEQRDYFNYKTNSVLFFDK